MNKKNIINFSNHYLIFRRTKIVATLGPASSPDEILSKLIQKGVNVFRINFSHGDPEEHCKNIKKIRDTAKKLNKHVAVLADLCGPKIRVGKFKNGFITLVEGKKIIITVKSVIGSENIIPSQYKGLIKEVKTEQRILLNDGAMEVKVIKKSNNTDLEAVVIRGGVLKDHKGMNLPDTNLKISALTEKDKKDVKYCIKSNVDYIALSFVRKESDIIELKNLLKLYKKNIPVISKIEKPEAIANINKIIEISDGIMVARGDLGVELPQQKVPLIQNELIKLANKFGKPVIVATQMLESMIENSRPTRAEVTDVASACMSGSDAVMLSGETAVGKFPVETVAMMDSILREVESNQWASVKFNFNIDTNKKLEPMLDAISAATSQISRDLSIRCIAVLTRTGSTARFVAADKPAAPIIAITKSESVLRQMNLIWGVYPFLANKEFKFNDFVKYASNIAVNLKFAKTGQYILILSGLKGTNAVTNSIVVYQVQ